MRKKSKTYELSKEEIKHIVNVLRKGTTVWKGRTDCLKKSRRRVVTGQYKNGSAKTRWEYKCAACKEYFRANEVEVDHIEEVGPFLGDWGAFILRMYCGPENLQVMCVGCHSRKTSGFNATLRFQRKAKEG
jgi:hypothetical protein